MRFISLLFILAWIMFSAYQLNKVINRVDERMKPALGKKILIDKDSVTIIDYSMLQETYTLSTGVEVSEDFVKNQLK